MPRRKETKEGTQNFKDTRAKEKIYAWSLGVWFSQFLCALAPRRLCVPLFAFAPLPPGAFALKSFD